jgi:hypothetical protein
MDTINTILVESPLKACAVSAVAVSIAYFTWRSLSRKHTHSYPPGPPQQPIIGALGAFPKDHFYQRFTEWAEQYGVS